MKHMIVMTATLLLFGCADGLIPSSSPFGGEPRTYESQVDKHGYGLKVMDAYYLPPSSAGTRMVVTIEIANESENGTLVFNAGYLSDDTYIETNGAGNLPSDTYAAHQFTDEFEASHSWCSHGEIPRGGSLQCALFFFKPNTTFTANAIALTSVRVQGLYDGPALTTELDAQPRQL